MTTETTENTQTTTTSPATKGGKAKPKSSDPSASGADKSTLGFEYEFLPLPADVAGTGVITINPKEIAISKIDARNAPALIDDEFVASIKKDGLIQDPCLTYARHRKTGKEVFLAVAGRRRCGGAVQAGLKTINCKVIEIKDLKQYLILAGQENMKRENMTFWDKFTYFSNLMSTGLKQSELKDVLSITEGNVSQVLAVGKLDERVQKMVREGTKEPFKSYAASAVRELKRINDPELQVAYAQQAIEEGMEPKALKFIVEKWLNKQAADAESAGKGKGAKTGGRGVKLPDEVAAKDIKIIGKTDMVNYYNYLNARFAKLKASDKAKPETVAYAKGLRDATAHAAGLAELPSLPEEKE